MDKYVPRLYSTRTADQLEAMDTRLIPLSFYNRTRDFEGKIFYAEVGDDLIIRSDDGDDFIAHVADIDDDGLMFHVVLD